MSGGVNRKSSTESRQLEISTVVPACGLAPEKLKSAKLKKMIKHPSAAYGYLLTLHLFSPLAITCKPLLLSLIKVDFYFTEELQLNMEIYIL